MKTMTKEDFLKLDLSKISQVYSGKRNCCRCGCGGTYTATSHMTEPRSEVNNELVAKHLKRAKRLVASGANVDYADTYADIQTGANSTLTFYFDEVKPIL